MITYYNRQNDVMPGMQDMVKWQETGWTFMKAWCAAGRPAGLPCGSKQSIVVG